MKTKLYHTTGRVIESISTTGMFGSFLFFGEEAAHYGDIMYTIELDSDDVIEPYEFFYREDASKLDNVVSEVMDLFDCDEEAAQDFLSEKALPSSASAEDSWELQKLTAECAQVLGYRAVAVQDEYGTSYMIDMLNHESELVRV